MGLYMHIRRSLLTLSLFALFVCALAPAAVAADSTTFQDPNGAYSFTLPDGWQVQPATSSGVAFLNPATNTVLVIATVPAGGLSLDDATQVTLAALSQQPAYVAGPGGVTDLTVGDQPAKGFSFHSNNTDGSPLSTGAVAVINKDTVYLLTFLTTPDQENASNADVTTIITSWKFTS